MTSMTETAKLEALKPFADAVHMIHADAGDGYAPDWSPFITAGAYRSARAALAGSNGE